MVLDRCTSCPAAAGGGKDPEAIIYAVKCHKVTVMHFVPSMLRMFLLHIQKHPERLPDLKSLKYVFASGEALTPELVNFFIPFWLQPATPGFITFTAPPKPQWM